MNKIRFMLLSMLLAMGMIFTSSVSVMAQSIASEQTGFEVYLSNVTELGSITNGNKQVYKNVEPNGTAISLLDNGSEVTYEKGLVVPTRGVVTYSGISKYGYESFEAYIGIGKSGRSDSSSTVKFEVYGDDKLLFESDAISGNSNQQFIQVENSGMQEIYKKF